jgi:hypothetical protein
VGEQLADGDSVLVAPTKGWDIVHDGVIKPDLLFVVEDHDGRRGTDDLAQGRDVVDGALGINRGAALAPGESAESFLKNRRALSPDNYRSAGIATCSDSALDHSLNGSEPAAGHADFCRGLDRQTITCAGQRQGGENDSKQL